MPKITGQKEQSETINKIHFFHVYTNLPSEGCVLCEAAMRMIKQNETAKT